MCVLVIFFSIIHYLFVYLSFFFIITLCCSNSTFFVIVFEKLSNLNPFVFVSFSLICFNWQIRIWIVLRSNNNNNNNNETYEYRRHTHTHIPMCGCLWNKTKRNKKNEFSISQIQWEKTEQNRQTYNNNILMYQRRKKKLKHKLISCIFFPLTFFCRVCVYVCVCFRLTEHKQLDELFYPHTHTHIYVKKNWWHSLFLVLFISCNLFCIVLKEYLSLSPCVCVCVCVLYGFCHEECIYSN